MSTAQSNDQFVDLDLSPQEFRKLGYRVVDIMAEYYANVRQVPVFPQRTSGEVEALFDEPLPLEGQEPEGILDEWQSKVLPNATHLGSPRYFGFVNGSGTMLGALADALAASINAG